MLRQKQQHSIESGGHTVLRVKFWEKRKPGVTFSEKNSQEDSKRVRGSQDKQPRRGMSHGHQGDTAHNPLSSSSQSRNQDYRRATPLFLKTWDLSPSSGDFYFFCCCIAPMLVSISQASTMVDSRGLCPPQMQAVSAWLPPLDSAINPLWYALWSKGCGKARKKWKEKIFSSCIFWC